MLRDPWEIDWSDPEEMLQHGLRPRLHWMSASEQPDSIAGNAAPPAPTPPPAWQSHEQLRRRLDRLELPTAMANMFRGEQPAAGGEEMPAIHRVAPPGRRRGSVEVEMLPDDRDRPAALPQRERGSIDQGDIGWGRPPPEAPSPPPTMPVGFAQWRETLQAAVQQGRFRSAAEAIDFARGLNPTFAQTYDDPAVRAGLARAVAAVRRDPRTRVDLYTAAPPPPPPPDISDVRGANADVSRLYLRNQAFSQTPLVGPVMQIFRTFGGEESADAFRRGLVDVPTLGLADEGGAYLDSLLGRGSYEEHLARERTIDAYDEENNFGARLTGQIGGGFVLPIGRAASIPRLAGVSGAYGFGYGFGSGQGGLGNRFRRGATGAVIGGGTGALFGLGGRFAANRIGRAPPGGERAIGLARAADQEGVRISPPIVAATARERMADLAREGAARRVIGASLKNTADDIEAGSGRLARDGTALEPGAMGERMREAVERELARDRTGARRFLDRLLGPADGPLTGEQVLQRAQSWLRGGAQPGSAAERMWRNLRGADRLDLAATIASRIGRPAADEPFSVALFLENTRNLPPTARALLFGREGAASIANLRDLAGAYEAAARRLANVPNAPSRWAEFLRNTAAGSTIGTAIGGGPGGAAGLVGGAIPTAVATGLPYVSARMLMSHDMSRWLNHAARMSTAAAIRRHIERLSTIAARNPAIAQEALGLRDAMLEEFGGRRSGARPPVTGSPNGGGETLHRR